jgi:hypothetical protein
VHVERGPFGRNDPCRILTAMLEHEQPVVQELIYGTTGDDAQDSTHSIGL